jgi:hypothetical protein
VREITLTKEKVALVDDEDYERVSQFKWCAHLTSGGRKWYAVRRTRKLEKGRWRSVNIRLHSFILDIAPCELPFGYVVDHDDDDGLNCQRGNLKIITQRENMEKVAGWKKKPVAVECFL